jgi:hypothetical protein
MPILTLAEFKTLTNTTSAGNDAYITSLLPVVQDQIENYCDRLFTQQDYIEWYKYSEIVLLKQYPVNNVKYIGYLTQFAGFTPLTGYTYEITDTGIVITNDTTFTATTFLFTTYGTLLALKTAIEAAIPAITMTILSGYDNYNYRLLRTGTGYTVYGATRLDAMTYLDDNRSLKFITDYSAYFLMSTEIDCNLDLMVIYNAGYGTVPNGLKFIACNIIKDILAIQVGTSVATGGGVVSGIYKSESVDDYSYTLADPGNNTSFNTVNISQVVSKYYGDLDYYKKLTV